MLRIIAGEFRRRQLYSPVDAEVSRPMASRVKESIFNLLRGWFEDARVLDLYAGVGTMGLEAVSRGASEVVMVERDRAIHELLEANIDELDCRDRARAVHADALGPLVLAQAPRPVDIAFLDPPYPLMRDDRTRAQILEQVARLRDVMADKSFVVLRAPMELDPAEGSIPGFDGPEVHAYGREMVVHLWAPTAAMDADHGSDDESD